MNASFDTLTFAERLQASGMRKAMAEGVAHAIQDIAMQDVATRADLREAVHTLTLHMGVMLGVGLGVVVAIISLK